MAPSPVLVPTASLHGKVAIVTGSSRGIGAGCALELAKRGSHVVVNYSRSRAAADALVSTISSLTPTLQCTATAIQADVTSLPDIEHLFTETKRVYGKIDIVVSNSGMESFEPTETVTETQYDAVFGLNTRAQFFVGQAAWKHVEKDGRIVLMSSLAAGSLGVRDHALYSASKLAVVGFVKSFAADFGARGIRVNGIAPGGVLSDMFHENCWRYIPGATQEWSKEAMERATAERCPLGRCAVPEDIARVVAFLVSEDGGWVNGQILTVTGGYP